MKMTFIEKWRHYYQLCCDVYPSMSKLEALRKGFKLISSWDEKERIEPDVLAYCNKKWAAKMDAFIRGEIKELTL